MFSKQHFEVLAETVKETRQLLFVSKTVKGKTQKEASLATLEFFASRLADRCQQENPRFDRQRFLKACGSVLLLLVLLVKPANAATSTVNVNGGFGRSYQAMLTYDRPYYAPQGLGHRYFSAPSVPGYSNPGYYAGPVGTWLNPISGTIGSIYTTAAEMPTPKVILNKYVPSKATDSPKHF